MLFLQEKEKFDMYPDGNQKKCSVVFKVVRINSGLIFFFISSFLNETFRKLEN